jgi:hypothetical protein
VREMTRVLAQIPFLITMATRGHVMAHGVAP